ncbi:MAG: hypothetical protein DI540_26030 [Sphingobium sp.]|nr:MAG: hypothetical protein DI540_26030 [Sphingobium sp.]
MLSRGSIIFTFKHRTDGSFINAAHRIRRTSKFVRYSLTILSTSLLFSQPAFSAEQTLPSKGINLSKYVNFETSYNEAMLAKRLGFGLVRLPIPNEFFNQSNERVREILSLAKTLNDNGLFLIVDFHPTEEFKKEISSSYTSRNQFLEGWGQFSKLAKSISSKTYFEILNEPGKIPRWWELQREAISRIRKFDKKRVVIASPEGASSISLLLSKRPYRDNNVIYNFHYYSPMEFTHQGANFGSRKFKNFHGVPYPVPGYYMSRYPSWGAEATDNQVRLVKQWSERFNVKIICDEFGVYKGGGVSPADRVKYIKDVRESFDKFAIPWTMWQLVGGFGFKNTNEVDSEILYALGFRGE